MDVINWFVTYMTDVFSMLNLHKFANAGLGSLLLAFVFLSMIISVFWRGARG